MTPTVPIAAALDSTLLASAAYDVGESLLQMELRDGAIYLYFGVPEAVYQELLAATSKGRYFNCQIRSRFRYTCLRRPQ